MIHVAVKTVSIRRKMSIPTEMVYTMSDISSHYNYLKAVFLCVLILIVLSGCRKLPEKNAEEDMTKNDPEITLTSCQSEDSTLYCEYELIAPKEAIYLQVNVEQYIDGIPNRLLTGGISIGDERLPIHQIIGGIRIAAVGEHPLSLVIDCSGFAEYTISSEIFDTSFTANITPMPIIPTINEAIQLVEIQPQTSDCDAFLLIEIIFGDKIEEFEMLKNSPTDRVGR